MSKWKDAWYTKFDWIEFDYITGRYFYKICNKKWGGRLTFVTMDNINIRISDSTFQDHENSAENGHLTWAMQNRKRTIKKNIIEANQACNGTMHFFCFRLHII